ncbi:LacI family transcriptional regulator [Bacillus manliponensis]|uniref:LacI family transcriptional regulator n=1 Tax=Bacillus manliponensis TaxID=574376 RepID=A0A073KFL6_9BACI|nr:LacI family DNA-binding transcriptional regulator [Bacillus manliponensis]KEK21093.1 LacI family transcriptional regulator [Bacillus manliponensis]
MATIREVAKLAGVSVATVSRVLNEKGYVHEDTVKQVKEAIEKLQYKPQVAAKALFKKSSTMIAVIVPSLENITYLQMLATLEDVAHKEGYQMIVCSMKSNPNYMNELLENHIAGIVMMEEVYESLQEKTLPVPFVIFGESNEERFIQQSCNSMNKAVTFLKEKSCQFVAYIRVNHEPEEKDERVHTFLDHAFDRQLSHKVITIEAHNIEVSIQEILRKYPYIDGIIAQSDQIASGAMRAARNLRISIPMRLQLIGLEGTLQGEWMTPSLTTISQPLEEKCAFVMQLLMEKVQKKQIKQEVIHRNVVLTERESTK